ncbi:MAG: ATP-dependent DNA helicase RecG [Treponema sp.]|jgi:ATP-dependent DNA helicase RecG|nr:ATP-dependent DNA helicase RecG [Treponema sp.]
MFLRSLAGSVDTIRDIGSASLKPLSRLGINTAADLLVYYPRDWEDRSKSVLIDQFETGNVCTVITVISRKYFFFKSAKALKVNIEDESRRAVLICFYINKLPWLDRQLAEGSRHYLWGSFKYNKKGELHSSSFETKPYESGAGFKRILPVYPLTSGLKQNKLHLFMANALKSCINNIENELPDELIEKYGLFSKKEALKNIHFPSSLDDLEKAKKTLIYEELFYLEIMAGKRAFERRKRKNVNIAPENGKKAQFTPLQARLTERLSFKLTDGQTEAAADINSDMGSGAPMSRLLQGDVGSGKTLVSFLAALRAIDDRGQAAIMAPTELLARQHAENAARLLEPLGCRIAFLTGNIKAAGRKELLKNLGAGEIDIVVGTHALFSKDVQYKNLKLVVIDEQHRFGVMQRSLIMTKGGNPHLLMMSATPIPRTLALTVFGDMDVSVIKDMPPGRKPVETHLARQSSERRVYDFIRRELEKGRQAYFVYPLIEGTEDLKDAVSMSRRLAKEVFPEFKTALIHSKLDEDVKRKTMDDFYRGKIDILAATSVVEVGVDVPNATCMVIEHAQRFGLSALHQLRGRVGRGQDQSYCFLVYSDEYTEDAKVRLLVMLKNNDGFIIAEEDLKMRGPGQIAGTEQSGYLALGIANPVRDADELIRARTDAFSILESDPDLLLEGHRVIARVLEQAPPLCNVAF